MYAGAVFYQ